MRLVLQEATVLYWFGGVLAVCALLAAVARRIPPAAVTAILVLSAASVLAVRLRHEGRYPFPGGLDLAAVVASLVLAVFIVLLGRGAVRRGSPLLRVAFALVPIALLLGLVAVLHEIEEVVVLRTFDERGAVLETRLWVVDHDGTPWLLTDARGRHTLRLEARPQVELVRHGIGHCYRAVPLRDRATIEKILRLRGEKYAVQRFGLAIGFDRIFRSRERPIESYAIAIRLDPCPSSDCRSLVRSRFNLVTGRDGARHSGERVLGRRSTVMGCDFSAGMLQHAAKRDRSIAWVRADATRLPFAEGSFDALTRTEAAPAASALVHASPTRSL